MISQIVHSLAGHNNTAIPKDWPKCPKCDRPLLAWQSRDSVNTRFNLNTREIYGYCCRCGSVQIELATEDTENTEVYKIIRYRFYKLVPMAWNTVNDLPVPIVSVGNEIKKTPVSVVKRND